MTVEEMLRGQQARVSFHMPGHKMRAGESSRWDVTELEATDDLHHPQGPYRELARRLARVYGAAVSLPLVGGSTRGVQLMILSALHPGEQLILPRSAHASAWSACAIGGIDAVSVALKVNGETQMAAIDADDVRAAIYSHPHAKALLLTRPDYYGRMEDVRDIIRCAHGAGLRVLVDEAHGAHFVYAGLPTAGELGADLWVNSLHKTLPALTPCAVLHAADADGEEEIRRKHRMLETSSPSSLLLRSMESCLDYMEKDGKRAIAELKDRCEALRRALCADERFARTADFYRAYAVDPLRLVIDVRGTGLSGFEASARLAELGVDMEMADRDRLVGIPSVLSTQEDFDALLDALQTLPRAGRPMSGKTLPAMPQGTRACGVREAMMGQNLLRPLACAQGAIAADNMGIYPPGVPLCVAGERVLPQVAQAMLEAEKMGAVLFGVNERGEIATMRRKYDCVIFDLDGTLMDTSLGIIRSVQFALHQMGLPDGDLTRIRRFIGPPLHRSFMEFYNMEEEKAAEAVELYRARYSQVGVMEYTPYAGMAELVRDLKKGGVKVAVATGKPEKFSRVILEREGLMPYIDRLVTPALSDTRDNKPEMVRGLVEEYGSNALMVGDRCFDIEGARANGIDSAGILHGFGSSEELRGSGATYLVEGARELRGLVL